jgi:hypothetical protein
MFGTFRTVIGAWATSGLPNQHDLWQEDLLYRRFSAG